MINFFRQRNNGFTLIETLVAITILMIAIAGPLTIAHRGLIAAVEAKDQMIASYLAQDAMEYIKNVRDNNLKDGETSGQKWLTGFNLCTRVGVGNDSRCTIDTVNGDPYLDPWSAFKACPSNGNCENLYITDQGYTQVNNGVPAIFTRWAYIDIDNSGNDASANVVVTVEWESTTGTNSTVLKNQMFEIIR